MTDEAAIEAMARAMSHDPDSVTTCRAHPMGMWLDDDEPDWHGYVEAATRALAALREMEVGK